MTFTTLTGFAGIGVLVGLWNNIKLWFSKIISLFLVTIEIDNHMISLGLSMYILENFKCSPLGRKRFNGRTDYVRPIKRNQLVIYEEIPDEKTLWYNKNKRKLLHFIWVKKNDSHINISFFRWSYNKRDFLIQASDLYNDKLMSDERGWRDDDRFYIVKMSGSIGESKERRGGESSADMSSEPAVPCDGIGQSSDDLKHTATPLKWLNEDIGQPNKKNATGDLSLQSQQLDALKEAILWRDSEKWFKERLVPWKRGWLLWGSPGTGKTAFVRAMGQELNMPIVTFDLATMTNQDFNKKWASVLGSYCPCICLFEDIDGVFNGRENIVTKGKMDNGLSFDCFLNALDGVENTDGVFIIVTTNNLDKLDSAIGIPDNGDGISSRPGRIDRTIYFDALDKEGLEKMANRILGDFDRSIWEYLIDKGLDHKDTGAQFQERCCRLALNLFWGGKTSDC